jgi:hypothetical protein
LLLSAGKCSFSLTSQSFLVGDGFECFGFQLQPTSTVLDRLKKFHNQNFFSKKMVRLVDPRFPFNALQRTSPSQKWGMISPTA